MWYPSCAKPEITTHHCNAANSTLGGMWQLFKDDATQSEIGSERSSKLCKSRGNKDSPNISLQTGRHPSSQVLRHSGLHLIHLAGTDTTLCDHRTPPEVPNTLMCLLKTLPSSTVTFFCRSPTLNTDQTQPAQLGNSSTVQKSVSCTDSALHEPPPQAHQ